MLLLHTHFQITMSALWVLIIVMAMRHAVIRMDHLPALVTLDTLEAEWHVQVGLKAQVSYVYVKICRLL